MRARVVRIMAGFISQAAGSLSNLLLTVAVARTVGPTPLGSWAVAFSIYVFALAVVRAGVGTTSLIGPSERSWTAIASPAVSAAACLAVLASVVGLVLATVVPEEVGRNLVVISVGMPFLLVYDTLRFALFADGRSHHVASQDLIVLLFHLPLLFWVPMHYEMDPAGLTALWIFPFIVVTVTVMALGRVACGLRHLRSFAAQSRLTSVSLIAEASLTAGATALLPVLLSLALGLYWVGVIRGAQTLVGVIGIAVAGLTPIATVEAKGYLKNTGAPRRFLMVWSLSLAGMALAFGLLMVAIPDRIGEALLGASWPAVVGVLPFFVAQAALRGPYTGVPILMRVAHAMPNLLALRLRTGIVNLFIPVAGALVWGLEGVLWGLIVGTLWANLDSLRAWGRLRSAGKGAEG